MQLDSASEPVKERLRRPHDKPGTKADAHAVQCIRVATVYLCQMRRMAVCAHRYNRGRDLRNPTASLRGLEVAGDSGLRDLGGLPD